MVAAAAMPLHSVEADKSVLIIDSATSGRERLARSFRDVGFQATVADGFENALPLVERNVPYLILVDINIGGRLGLQLVQRLRTMCPESKIIVLTAQPSIATAVRTIHAGAATYLVKPATAQQILASMRADSGLKDEDLRPTTLTLDRAIWEYMREIVETAGSISEASRRLGVERRSLRRMLVKYAPR